MFNTKQIMILNGLLNEEVHRNQEYLRTASPLCSLDALDDAKGTIDACRNILEIIPRTARPSDTTRALYDSVISHFLTLTHCIASDAYYSKTEEEKELIFQEAKHLVELKFILRKRLALYNRK